jgi:hypothetical protein
MKISSTIRLMVCADDAGSFISANEAIGQSMGFSCQIGLAGKVSSRGTEKRITHRFRALL